MEKRKRQKREICRSFSTRIESTGHRSRFPSYDCARKNVRVQRTTQYASYVHADALPLPRDRACIRNFLHRDRGGNARGKPTCIGRLEIYFPPRWRSDETASSRAPPRKSKCENDVTCINSHASAVLLLSASREIIPPDSTRVEEPWEHMYRSRLKSHWLRSAEETALQLL